MSSKEVAIHERAPVTVQQPSAAQFSFNEIQRMAASFAKSGLFGVKDADQALSLMMYGQALGKHPAIIMRDYDLIQNRLAKKADSMLRDFQASGGRVQWTKYTDEGVTGVFTHPYSPIPLTVDWDMARATKAGLAGKTGDMYKKFTRQMFRARCISEGVRTTAPDCTENMYTPEEVRTIVENDPEPVSISQAVTDTVNALPKEVSDRYIDSMDVTTLDALKAAFKIAWRAAESAGDERAQERFKGVYDSMRKELDDKAQIASDAPPAEEE